MLIEFFFPGSHLVTIHVRLEWIIGAFVKVFLDLFLISFSLEKIRDFCIYLEKTVENSLNLGSKISMNPDFRT